MKETISNWVSNRHRVANLAFGILTLAVLTLATLLFARVQTLEAQREARLEDLARLNQVESELTETGRVIETLRQELEIVRKELAREQVEGQALRRELAKERGNK